MLRFIQPLLLSLALVSSVSPAFAGALPGTVVVADNEGGRGGGWRDRRVERQQERQGENNQDRIVPLDAVISGLMSSYPGKPLDARGPMQRGQRLIYEIVWLTENGRQIVIIVDATTGQVMRVHGLN
jgi:hypothetical protein